MHSCQVSLCTGSTQQQLQVALLSAWNNDEIVGIELSIKRWRLLDWRLNKVQLIESSAEQRMSWGSSRLAVTDFICETLGESWLLCFATCRSYCSRMRFGCCLLHCELLWFLLFNGSRRRKALGAKLAESGNEFVECKTLKKDCFAFRRRNNLAKQRTTLSLKLDSLTLGLTPTMRYFGLRFASWDLRATCCCRRR